MTQKGIFVIIIILLIVGFLGVAGGVYYFAVQKPNQPEQPVLPTQPKEKPVVQPEEQQSSPPDETAGWKTYKNDEWGFEIKYPEVLKPEVKIDIPADNIFSLYFGDGKTFKMSIFDTGMEGQIRLYTIKNTEKKVLIDNIEGTQFRIVDQKEETDYIPQTLVKNKGKLYLFIGEGKIFNQILLTFRFIK